MQTVLNDAKKGELSVRKQRKKNAEHFECSHCFKKLSVYKHELDNSHVGINPNLF